MAKTAATEPSQPGRSSVVQSPDKPTAKAVKGIPEAKVNDFLRGFLDVTKVPKSHPDMQIALAFLASLDPLTVLRDPFRAGADIHDYMQGDPIYGERMTKPDLHAFLRVLMRLPGKFVLATQLREAAMEDGQISKIVAEWEEAGMDMQTCTPEDIESAVSMLAPSDPFARMPE